MPVRVPASQLYKITEEDLRGAIAVFRESELPVTFEDSKRFDLLVDGYRRFPPKVIIALAARRPLGRVLSSDEFSGGDVTGEETITIAARYGLQPVLNVRCDSIQASNRAVGVTWTQLAFRR